MKTIKYSNSFFIRFVSVILILISSKTLLSQPYNDGKGMVYGYAGTSFTDVNTKASFEITGINIPEANATLELEKDLAFPSSNQLLYIKFLVGGRFQFAGSYMSLHRNGDSYLTKDFTFGNNSYSIGARVKGYFNTDYYSGTLRVSVVKKTNITTGFSLGVRYLKLNAGLDANSNGVSVVRDGSYDIPVILPGIHLSVYVIPSILARGSVEYFKIKLNGTEAKAMEYQVSAEYYFLKFLGAGIGYSYMDLRGDGIPDNDLYLKGVNYTVKGFNVFAALRF